MVGQESSNLYNWCQSAKDHTTTRYVREPGEICEIVSTFISLLETLWVLGRKISVVHPRFWQIKSSKRNKLHKKLKSNPKTKRPYSLIIYSKQKPKTTQPGKKPTLSSPRSSLLQLEQLYYSSSTCRNLFFSPGSRSTTEYSTSLNTAVKSFITCDFVSIFNTA